MRVAFLAGLIGVLVAIPPLPFPFLRLMIIFLAAGFLAVYLYMRRTGQRLSMRAGARMGWITGVFSFTIFTVQLTAAVLASSSEGGFANVLKQQLQQMPAKDARTSQALQLIQEPTALGLLMVMILVFLFIFLTVLPTLGGLLGAKLLAREH